MTYALLLLCALASPAGAQYEVIPTDGRIVLDQVYQGGDVRIYCDDILLCVDTPGGTIVLWSAPEPQPARLGPQGLALVKLQIAMSSLYSREGLPKDPGELQKLKEEANTLAEVDSIVSLGELYKIYFSADEGIPTYWESFVRGPFPQQYIDHPETFVPSVERMREGIREQIRFYINCINSELNQARLVVLWPRERRPGMQVIVDHMAEALREINQLMQGLPVEAKYLNAEAAEAVRRW